MTLTTTAATDSSTSETTAAVVASPSRVRAYVRTAGRGTWTLRTVHRMSPATIAATYAIADRSPEWDATVDDDDQPYALLDRSGHPSDRWLNAMGVAA